MPALHPAHAGKHLHYDTLVLATGSSARVPPEFESRRGTFLTLNSLDDLMALRSVLRSAASDAATSRWAIGLIGCELASDLHKAGAKVCLFHRAPRLMELQLQEFQSEALAQHFDAMGVEVRLNETLTELPAGFDATVVCTGFLPRTGLARAAGLDTDKGIVVDGFLRTDDPHVFAVGDVAQVSGRLFPFVAPVRSQALWLVQYLLGKAPQEWIPPSLQPPSRCTVSKCRLRHCDERVDEAWMPRPPSSWSRTPRRSSRPSSGLTTAGTGRQRKKRVRGARWTEVRGGHNIPKVGFIVRVQRGFITKCASSPRIHSTYSYIFNSATNIEGTG